MSQRRTLMEGISNQRGTDPAQEAAFVYGEEPRQEPRPKVPAKSPEAKEPAVPMVQLTTRLRADVMAALKRASLERQLEKQEPHKVQDIVEAALIPWLRDQGYLS